MQHSATEQAVLVVRKRFKCVVVLIMILGLLVSPMYADVQSVEDDGAYWSIVGTYTQWILNIRWNDTLYNSWILQYPGPLGEAYKDCDCQTHDARILPSDGYSYYFYLNNPSPAWLTWAFYGKQQVLATCPEGTGCDESCRNETLLDGVYYGAWGTYFY